MKDVTLLVLMSLADGPKHGYAIQGDIESFADHRLGPGTLYGAIDRLEREGLIRPLPSSDRRRPYEVTPAGRAVLRERIDALRGLVSLAEARAV